MPVNGTSFRVKVALGYSPAYMASGVIPPSAPIARNSDGSPYYYGYNGAVRDEGTILIPTPFSASVEEIAPAVGVRNYSGKFLPWRFQTDGAQVISAQNGPIAIKKALVSN